MRRRWAGYFKLVLNMADVREADINVSADWLMPVLGELNERATSVNEMISGKAPGLDVFPVECLKKDGMAVLEWLTRLLNASTYGLAWCMYSAPVEREG